MNFDKTVLYKNEINTVALTNFNPMEIDLLFTILSKVKNKGDKSVTYSFSELRKFVNFTKSNSIVSFAKELDSVYKKLLSLNIKVGDDKKWIRFVLFTEYEIDIENQVVNISVNHKFVFLINKIVGEFTKFELKELTSLSSVYSKNMYRLLKQWRLTGFAVYTMEEFRRLMDIPESYNMGNITQRVLKPIKSELSPYFKNLRIKKVKGKGKNSRKVVRLEFKFKPEERVFDGKIEDIDYDKEYSRSELLELPKEIAETAQPVIGVYKPELDLIGVYEGNGSFTILEDQDKIKWIVSKPVSV